MKKRVLVMAQEMELRARIAQILQQAGYGVELAAGKKRALELVEGGGIETAIVVPRFGLADLAAVQELSDIAPRIIILTGQRADAARFERTLPRAYVHLLEPLDEQRLLSLLAQAMRLPSGERREDGTSAESVTMGPCRLDLAGRTFFRADGTEVPLTRAESLLLAAFARSPGRILSRDHLSHAIAGHGAEAYDRSIDMHIARLRRKIEPQPKSPRFILTVPGGGYKFVASQPDAKRVTSEELAERPQTARSDSTPPTAQSALALPNKPSIAVMPFQNMSGDSSQDYFADGMIEDVITALSRMRLLFVIARNSTFIYKGRAVDIKQVGRELGVRYILEGSVRKSTNRVRVTAQLIDALTGAHLWADRFESAPADVFDLQDQVATRIVCAVIPTLQQAEIVRAARKPTENLDAYDFFLRGMASLHKWTKDNVNQALELFYEAIKLDPDFAAAYGAAAQCYANHKANGYMIDRAQEIAETNRLARRAVTLSRDDAFALASGGNALAYVVGEVEDGNDYIDQALALNPNLAAAWYYGAWVKIFLGEHDVAVEYLSRALRLDPRDPRIGLMHTAMAFAHFFAGRHDEASSWADRAAREMPHLVVATYISAASHALAGRLEVAERAIAVAEQFNPARRISDLKDEIPLRRPQDYANLGQALRKAGLPL